jgi:hypothetical protein
MAFKPFCLTRARELGYDMVLWLDASIDIRQPLDEIWAEIERTGYILFQENHSVGEYCKDGALATLGIGREESFMIPSCWSCALGLDLRQERSRRFLDQWRRLAVDGVTFPGPKWSGVRGWTRTASSDPRVSGHRYDQTAASVIAWRLGMVEWKSKEYFARFFSNNRVFLKIWPDPRRQNSLRCYWRAFLRWINPLLSRERHVVLKRSIHE